LVDVSVCVEFDENPEVEVAVDVTDDAVDVSGDVSLIEIVDVAVTTGFVVAADVAVDTEPEAEVVEVDESRTHVVFFAQVYPNGQHPSAHVGKSSFSLVDCIGAVGLAVAFIACTLQVIGSMNVQSSPVGQQRTLLPLSKRRHAVSDEQQKFPEYELPHEVEFVGQVEAESSLKKRSFRGKLMKAAAANEDQPSCNRTAAEMV
jgi:hypothetical protein